MLKTHGPEPIRAAPLDAQSGHMVRHGFFTRAGGVSSGIYRGLNAGAGSFDDPRSVAENRRRVAEWLGVEPENLVTVHQVHSPDAVTVVAPFETGRPKADAMVTATSGLALAVLTADCGPVLMADSQAGVISAVHAGWKGALSGVLENTITEMEKLGAARSNITAVLGPAIGPGNYEVGPEFYQRFHDAGKNHARYFQPSEKAGHFMFDLPGFIRDRLHSSGVNASDTGNCTYEDEERFFSYRRTTHRNEADYGRQISAIVLEKP